MTGGSSSRVKLGRDMRRAVRSADDSAEGVSRLRISMLFIVPFAWPFWPVAIRRLCLERRLERLAFFRVIDLYRGQSAGGQVICEGIGVV